MKLIFAFLILLFEFNANCFGQFNFYSKLADSALTLITQKVKYDPSYYSLKYPNGDLPSDKGVCTDVLIRAYRKVGIDLQKKVHEDMLKYFISYPKIWGLTKPDKNIDHRRVPNLMIFFSRHGETLSNSTFSSFYLPGDIVCWNLGGSVTHIGIVANKKSKNLNRNLIVHNIGAGQVVEDCLFKYKIIGHYRYGIKI